MSHVLEFFINLKTKNKRHVENFGVVFSLSRSCNFKTYHVLFVLQFYFEHYINKGCGHQISH